MSTAKAPAAPSDRICEKNSIKTRSNYLFTFENYRYVIFTLSNAGLICGQCIRC